jgi:uncharacterized membrane protein HdeD (DUF308 family)
MKEIKHKYPLLHLILGAIMLLLGGLFIFLPVVFGEQTFTFVTWCMLGIGLIHTVIGILLIHKKRASSHP